MMRRKFVLVLLLHGFLFATVPQIKILELYPNSSFLTYKFIASSSGIKVDMPDFVEKQSISIDSECRVEKIILSPKQVIKDNFQNVVDKLIKEKELLSKKLETIKAKNALLKGYDFKNISVEKLKSSTKIFESLLFDGLDEQGKLEKEMLDTDEQLQKMYKKRSYKKKKSLEVYIDCDSNSLTTITFPLQGVSYNGLTLFDANSKTKKLQILQEAFITHSLGDILKNVDINLYSYAFSNPKTPVPFFPNYLDLYKPMVQKMASQEMIASAPTKSVAYDSMYKEAHENETRTKRVWEAKGVNLVAGEENEIIFNEQNSNIEFANYIDGYGSMKAYFEGEFFPKQSIINQKSKFLLDGVLVGVRYIDKMEKGKSAKIYFGRNDFISVKKKIDKDLTDESIFGTSKKTQKLWNYTIENSQAIPESIILVERIPVSKHEKIKVELLGSDKPNKISKDGKVVWQFILEPKQHKKINFGYSVTQPLKD